MNQDLPPTAGSAGTTTEGAPCAPANPPGYKFLDEIGRGGMGVVLRARDTALDRDVAIKLLSDRYPADSPAAQRFLNEARITGQLQHPGIPAVHQVGMLSDGRPFLAMKLIKGSTLAAILKDRTHPAVDRGRLLAIFEAVCQAIGYAHAHRVIHRDLKPANIMVGAFGEVQVMDWGLAKVLGEQSPGSSDSLTAEVTRAWTVISPTPEAGSHTQAGSLVGTAAFVSPEQAAGELAKVDERADVFGLGALLAVILTGKPPYVGENLEAVRVLAVRGKLDDCVARLDACGAESELVALCKKCLAWERADRPRDGGEVARAVAELRAAADERARRAELERVRLEGERAAAESRSAERRKRRRLALTAAVVLVAVVVVGFSALLLVQQRANAELADKQAKVEKRFELAQKAIAKLHTGVGEDLLLKSDQFKELRAQMLKEAADFYGDLEKLLEGEVDANSRRLLAEGYFQLAELTGQIGSQPEALAVHRKALAVRRELAAAAGADLETRLDVARSLGAMSYLLTWSNMEEALRVCREQHDVVAALAVKSPTKTVQAVLSQSFRISGIAMAELGKSTEALAADEKAVAILRKLAKNYPADTEFKYDLSRSLGGSALILWDMGKWVEALAANESASVMLEKLAQDKPLVTRYRYRLGQVYEDLAEAFFEEGKPAETLAAIEKARAISQKLADEHPAVSVFQGLLASNHSTIGQALAEMGKPAAAMAALEKALAIQQKEANDHPTDIWAQVNLADTYNRIGELLAQLSKPGEALQAHEKAREFLRQLARPQPAFRVVQDGLASSLEKIGLLLAASGKTREALAACQEALAIRQKLSDAQPDLTRMRGELANSLTGLGSVQRGAGRPAEAVPLFRRASALLEQLPTLSPRNLYRLACCHAQLAGVATEAGSGLTADQGMAGAERAMAALRQAYSAGFGVAYLRADASLDALRPREDFRKLVKELEVKASKMLLKVAPLPQAK